MIIYKLKSSFFFLKCLHAYMYNDYVSVYKGVTDFSAYIMPT